MLRLFKGTRPGVIILTAAFALFFWIISYAHPDSYTYCQENYPMPLHQLIISILGSSVLASGLISLAMVLITSALLVTFNTSSFFINERTFLPAVLFIILSSLFSYTVGFNPVLPATVILLFAIMRVSVSYREPGISYNFFDAALLISGGSLIYPNLIWFGLLLFIGLLIMRNFDIRETSVMVIGLVTPYALLYGFYYVTGRDLTDLSTLIGNSLFSTCEGYEWSRMLVVTMIFFALTLLVSLVNLARVFGSKKVRSRKIFALLIWVMVLTAAVFIFSPTASFEVFSFFLIPASYILSHYYIFMKRKKIVPEIMFSGTLILVLILHVLRFLEISI
jgi:hypothetical protein